MTQRKLVRATRNSDPQEEEMTSNAIWFRREGLFAPVTEEEVTAFDPPVTGRVPSELNGRYIRDGPNFMRGIDDSKNHWFLGSGMARRETAGRTNLASATLP